MTYQHDRQTCLVDWQPQKLDFLFRNKCLYLWFYSINCNTSILIVLTDLFCIRERTDEIDYIEVIKNPKQGNDFCQSYVGRRGGKQALTLNRNCFDYGTIAHELFHVLGFPHENQRIDSQDYIKCQ